MRIHGRIFATLQKRPFLRLSGALCLIWLLLNLPVLLGFRVIPSDALQFYPAVYFNAHNLRLGLAPWWNPYIYSGYPQIADPQGMMFSPLMMAWMLLRLAPGATWFCWGVLLHLLMGGIAMLGLLRRSGANAFGALIGASVFMAGGVAAARLEHVPIVIAYAYAPLVLLALRYFLAAPGWRRGLLLGAAAGAMVTQLVQVTYLFALMTAGYAVIASVMHWREYSPAARWRWCLGILVAIMIALMIGLPQLLFSWAYTSLSNRAALPLDVAAPASLDWRALLSLIDPNALHALRGTYTGPASKVEAYLYIGALPSLLLVGMGMAWRQRQQRQQLMFFAAVAIIATLYMFGLHTPLYGWLYSWLPGMEQFRRPSDAAYLLNFCFAMLAGLAASHFRLDSSRHVNALLTVAACWLLLSSLLMRDATANWQAATLCAAILTTIALWRLRRPGSTRRTATWLLLLLVVDYRCFNLNGKFNQGHDSARVFMHDASAGFLAEHMRAVPGTLPPRMETMDAGPHWDNNVILRGIPSTQGYNPLRYHLYDQWYGAREDGNLPRVDTIFNPSPDSALSDLLGVRYLVHGDAVGDRPWSSPSGYAKVFQGDRTEIWQNTRAYPRLLTPVRALIPAAGLPFTAAAFAATNFHDMLWLTPRDKDDQRSGQIIASSCLGCVQVSDAQIAPARLVVRTKSTAPGWLVLGELDFPGWQADVDGSALPIHRANGIFRAVCVPSGEHVVRFVFHPWVMVAEAWKQRRT